MLRRSRVAIATALVLGATPVALVSCELLDGLGSVTYTTGSDASAHEVGPDTEESSDGDEGAVEAMGPSCSHSVPGCPCGMLPATVDSGLCVATTEVTNADFEPFAKVVEAGAWDAAVPCVDADLLPKSQLDGATFPVVNVSWCGAREYCRSIHANLCTGPLVDGIDDWVLACEGPDHLARPYGDSAVEERCNVGEPHGQAGVVPWKDGSCERAGSSIFDMLGNVAEWGGCSPAPAYSPCVVRGGSYLSALDATCATLESLPSTTQSPSVGIRCCKAKAKAK